MCGTLLHQLPDDVIHDNIRDEVERCVVDLNEFKYTLDNLGNIIDVGTEHFRYPEILFQPESIDEGLKCNLMHTHLFNVTSRDLRSMLIRNQHPNSASFFDKRCFASSQNAELKVSTTINNIFLRCACCVELTLPSRPGPTSHFHSYVRRGRTK